MVRHDPVICIKVNMKKQGQNRGGASVVNSNCSFCKRQNKLNKQDEDSELTSIYPKFMTS